MKNVFVAILLCTVTGVNAGDDHPIAKVIKLLDGLKAKSIQEHKEEEVSFTKFEYWCSTSTAELKDAIADEKELIEELEDKLSGLKKKKASLEEEIGELEDQIKKNEAAAKKAKENRGDTAALYKIANSDLAKTIKAVEECIVALSGAEAETEGGKSFAQQHVKVVLALVGLKATSQQRNSLEAFAEPKKRPDQLAEGDLAAHTDKYDFKSENVIELLKQLKLSFEDDKLQGTKEETNSINAYELAKEARDNAHDAASKSKGEKEVELKATEDAIADADKELKSTQDDLKADSESLKDTTDACNVKKSEWEERSETRKLEIEAIDTAVKILAKSSGVRTEAPGNPVPPPSPLEPSFLQLTQMRSTDPQKTKVIGMLMEAAKDTHSRALERLAQEISAHLNGPFDQVNNMIEKMIFRLMDEQKVEDEHKNWCDQEISKTDTMKEDKDNRIEKLRAEIKVETGKVSVLTEEIKEANEMIAKIVTFMAEATEIRKTGKEENRLATKDSKQAQDSVSNAIAVLTAFYKESGEIKKESWEFVQSPVELGKKPSTWDSGYTGVADPVDKESGIIAILERVNEDFARMEAETMAQEAQDQKEYEEAMSANDIEKAERTQQSEMKTQEKARRNEKIVSLQGQKKDTEGELEKTEQYLEDLKPACVNGDSSYEDRKAARDQEIGALHTAQDTLKDAFSDKAKSFLQIRSHHQ